MDYIYVYITIELIHNTQMTTVIETIRFFNTTLCILWTKSHYAMHEFSTYTTQMSLRNRERSRRQ